MPQVPRLSGPQIEQARMPNIRVSTDAPREAFGLGAATTKTTESISDFAQKIKNDADQVAVMEAEKKLADFENRYLYDPKEGAFLKQGKDAFELPQRLDEDFTKEFSSISGELKNDVQRSAFQQRADQRRQQLERQTMQHVGAQIQKYDDQTTEALIDSEQNAAVMGYQDPQRIFQAIDRQKEAILKYGDRHGLPTEMIAEKVKQAESKTHASIISRMLTNGDDITAEAYYNANKPQIAGNHIEQVEKELEIGSTRGKAQRFADDVMNKGLSKEQAYQQASKIENPKVREATESRVAKMFAMKDEAEKEQQESLLEFAVNKFDKEGSIDDPKMVKVIQSMKPETRKALDSYVNSNPIRDDGVVYYRLRELAENPQTRDKFIKYDLTKELGNLSKDNWNKLIGLQRDLKNGGARSKAASELDGTLSDSQVMQDAFVAAGFKVSDKESFAKYRQKIDSEVIKYKQATGKKVINNDELRKITNEQLFKVVTEKNTFWRDTVKPRYQIEIDDIPEQDRRNIEEALRANGKPVNDSSILNLFIRKAQANERK